MAQTLREIQENFQAYIINDEKNILTKISSDHSDAIERIDIYKKGYSLRLIDILEKTFPVLYKIIGEELFRKLGQEYIDRYPSDNFSICAFSRHFSQFLLESGYDSHWSEIVTLEWALLGALDAADAPHIGVPDLSTVSPEDWPQIQFNFHPSVESYQFRFNAPKIAHAIMLENESIPELTENNTPVIWIIWRFELKSYFETITSEQSWMVQAIRAEKTFAEICEGLCQWLPEEEVALFAAGTLRNWLEKGLFSAIKICQTAAA